MQDLPATLKVTHDFPFCVCAQILHLMGIKYLYQLNVFLYCMFFFIAATILVLMIRRPVKWKKLSQEEREAAAYAG